MKKGKPLQKTGLKSKAALKKSGSLSSPKTKKRVPLEKKSLPELRKEADKWFSRYVRIRDSSYNDGLWGGTCITCSKTGTVVWKDDSDELRYAKGWNNGHFVGRDNWVTRYEEENNNLQCSFRCNNMRSGEYVKYKAALRLKYGDDVPVKLEKMAEAEPSHTYKHSREELLQIISDSKEQIKWYKEHLYG